MLLAAGIAGYFAWKGLRQKTEADNRAEWWRRAEWALDAYHSGDKEKKLVGLKVLGVLGQDKLAGPGELKVLEAAWQKPLAAAKHRRDQRGDEPALELLEETKRSAGAVVDAINEAGDNGTEGRNDHPEGGRS